MTDYSRFTDRARKVMQLANTSACKLGHECLEETHLLIGLITEGSGIAANVLKSLDVDTEVLLDKIRVMMPKQGKELTGKLWHSSNVANALSNAIEESASLGHSYVGTEHVLLGLLRVEDSEAANLFSQLGVRTEDVRHEILNLLGQLNDPMTEEVKALVKKFEERYGVGDSPKEKLTGVAKLVGGFSCELTLEQNNQWVEYCWSLPEYNELLRLEAERDYLHAAISGGIAHLKTQYLDSELAVNKQLQVMFQAGKKWYEGLSKGVSV